MGRLKRALFEAALSEGTIQVTIIAVPRLDVPAPIRIDGTVLDYGDNMAKPIPDLETTNDGISATLSFQNKPIKTFVPWSAIVRMQMAGKFIALWPIEVEQFARGQKAVA